MKKRHLKNLQLNKERISNLKLTTLKGGRNTADIEICGTDINSCYWLVCPFSQGATECIPDEQ